MKKIIVENLKYKYPLTDALALDNVSFEVEKGEFIGIIGANGSGKSTLCQAIVGLVPHFYKGSYGGSVVVDSLRVLDQPVSEIALKVGIVFQNPFNQVTGSKQTVMEEVAFGLENIGTPQKDMKRRSEEALDLLSITHLKDRQPFDLSGGQMQRVAIASIITMKPDILVLDEPTSQLDPEGAEEVFQAIERLSDQGNTVIMVEHKMEKIARYSSRVMLLHQGRVIDFDTPEKIFSRDDLETYGVTSPVFTRVCKSLNVKMRGSEYYPVTLEQAACALGGKLDDKNY